MTFEQSYEAALERMADGLPVDWEELARAADAPELRQLVNQLQILGGVGATHGQSPGVDPNAETRPSEQPTDVGTTRQWGRYELLRPIGKGSYGTVHLGRDTELERDVAIKLFHGRVTDRVRLEGRLLARIKHDHVVKVYDAAEHHGRFGLCMEFIDGRTLADIVRADGPLSPEQVAIDGQAIARALAALHANNVLHRDVTARNVMRERGGRIVLMDLGAGITSEPRPDGTRPPNIGTPLFMAPELFDEGSSATPQSDIYSLGVLLYHLLTGRYPVEGASTDDIRRNHRAGQRTRLDARRLDLPLPLARMVERASAPVVAERYQSAVDLLRDLNSIVSPPPAPEPLWRTWVRRTAIFMGVGLAAAALSGVITTFAFNGVISRPRAFDSDGAFDVLRLGGQALVQPLVVMGVALGFGAVLTLVGRLIPWPRRWWRRFWAALLPDDPTQHATVAAQVAVLVGLVILIAGYVLYGDMLITFIRSISTHGLEDFAVLRPGPEFATRRVAYRASLAVFLLIALIAWKQVRTVRLSRGGVVPSWIRGSGAALVGVLFVCCQAPYKLMNYNALPVVVLNGESCSLVGEHEGEARVFCAGFDVPRVRTIRLPEPGLTRCGFEASVFVPSKQPACR